MFSLLLSIANSKKKAINLIWAKQFNINDKNICYKFYLV